MHASHTALKADMHFCWFLSAYALRLSKVRNCLQNSDHIHHDV